MLRVLLVSAAAVYIIDEHAMDLIRAVRTRLNDDRTLQPGEKFDLGRKLDAALFAVQKFEPRVEQP